GAPASARRRALARVGGAGGSPSDARRGGGHRGGAPVTQRRPIIDDPRFIAGVRGERYAVLLARGDVLAACDQAQGALRERLAGLDVVYPRAHLTLASFARGTEIREVQAALDRWAGGTAPVSL